MKFSSSLRSKFALALTLSCIVSILIVGLAAMMISERQFKGIADERSLAAFKGHVIEYYSQYRFSPDAEVMIHQWMPMRGRGIERSQITIDSASQFGLPGGPPIPRGGLPNGDRPKLRPPIPREGLPNGDGSRARPPRPPNGPLDGAAPPGQNSHPKDPYILVAANYSVLLGAGLYRAGSALTLDKVNEFSEIEYQGEIIAYAFPKSAIALSKQEQSYLNAIVTSLIWAAIPAIGFALLLALFLSRYFSKRITRLSAAINQLGEGDFQNKVQLEHEEGSDELGLLAITFNKMANQLTLSNEKIIAQAQALSELSNRDELTGLHNRRYANSQASDHVARGARYGRPLSVAMCDIDNFKAINDTYLHEIGDEVLKAISKIFISNLREIDVIARYGGEEFVIIFPETTHQNAAILADKLRKSIAQHDWSSIAEGLVVTISIGISSNDSLDKFEEILSIADKNLYKAKHSGKNKVIA
jgi:two-component system cell cycle response regulator